jgi:hypothetical protein
MWLTLTVIGTHSVGCVDNPEAGQDQSISVLNHDTDCVPQSCTIVLDSLFSLQDTVISDSIPVLPDRVPILERTESGALVTVCCRRQGLAVYDNDSRRLQIVGLQPHEPIAFRRIITMLVGPGDTIHVGDRTQNGIVVLAPDMHVVRLTPTKDPYLSLPHLILDDGAYVVARQLPTADEAGFPIHLVDPTGNLLSSFGADPPQHRPDVDLLTQRIVASSRDGRTIWSVAPGQYTLERWSPRTGERLQVITVHSRWFKGSSAWIPDERLRPVAIIEGLREAADGTTLWVLLRDADLNWRPPREPNTMRVVSHAEYNATYDWVLEAIDTRTGTVLASRRFDEALWMPSTSTQLMSIEADSGSSRTIWTIWKPTLGT